MDAASGDTLIILVAIQVGLDAHGDAVVRGRTGAAQGHTDTPTGRQRHRSGEHRGMDALAGNSIDRQSAHSVDVRVADIGLDRGRVPVQVHQLPPRRVGVVEPG